MATRSDVLEGGNVVAADGERRGYVVLTARCRHRCNVVETLLLRSLLPLGQRWEGTVTGKVALPSAVPARSCRGALRRSCLSLPVGVLLVNRGHTSLLWRLPAVSLGAWRLPLRRCLEVVLRVVFKPRG